jgi:hypothetical protein
MWTVALCCKMRSVTADCADHLVICNDGDTAVLHRQGMASSERIQRKYHPPFCLAFATFLLHGHHIGQRSDGSSTCSMHCNY